MLLFFLLSRMLNNGSEILVKQLKQVTFYKKAVKLLVNQNYIFKMIFLYIDSLNIAHGILFSETRYFFLNISPSLFIHRFLKHCPQDTI